MPEFKEKGSTEKKNRTGNQAGRGSRIRNRGETQEKSPTGNRLQNHIGGKSLFTRRFKMKGKRRKPAVRSVGNVGDRVLEPQSEGDRCRIHQKSSHDLNTWQVEEKGAESHKRNAVLE